MFSSPPVVPESNEMGLGCRNLRPLGAGSGGTEAWYLLPMLGPCAQRQRDATACCANRHSFITWQ